MPIYNNLFLYSTFAGLTIYTFLKSAQDSRQTLVSSMVMLACTHFPDSCQHPHLTNFAQVLVWATRLGAHLVSRMHREGRDKRFDKAKQLPGLFFVYWFMQARTAKTVEPLLPFTRRAAGRVDRRYSAARRPAQHCTWGLFRLRSNGWFRSLACWYERSLSRSASSEASFTAFSAGWVLETVADYQKYVFRGDSRNRENFIAHGLWRHCRHPNCACARARLYVWEPAGCKRRAGRDECRQSRPQ